MPLPRWATVGYPVLDVVLFGLLVRALVNHGRRSSGIAMVTAGVGSWLVADLVWFRVDVEGFGARLADSGWMVGALLIAAGAWYLTSVPSLRAATSEGIAVPVSRWRIGMTISAFLVPWLFVLAADVTGDSVDPMPLFAVSAALAVFTYFRIQNLLSLLRSAAELHASSERRYRSLARNSSDAVVLLDPNGRILSGADGLSTLWDRSEPLGDGIMLLECAEVNSDRNDVLRQLFSRSVASPDVVVDGEFSISRREWIQPVDGCPSGEPHTGS